MQLFYLQCCLKISENLINTIATLELENLHLQSSILFHYVQLTLRAYLSCLIK